MVVPIAASPVDGASIDVLPRDTTSVPPVRGVLGGSHGFVLEVQLAEPRRFEANVDVILAGGVPGERVAVLARFLEERDGTFIFKRMSPWRPVDTRAFERLPARRQVVLRGAAGNVLGEGLTHDISLGGLAVAAEQPVGETHIQIAFGNGETPWLPCEVVQADERDGAFVLHLAFSDVGDAERACIAALVDQLATELELARAS